MTIHIQLLRADISSLKVDAIVNASESEEQHVSGGNLLCRFVIHTPIPRPDDAAVDEKIRQATLTSLERAESLAVGSLALPAMCATTSDEMTKRCAEIMVASTLEFGETARSLQRVVYCLFGEETFDIFSRVMREMKQ